MARWTILHHHNNGTAVYMVESKEEPTTDQVDAGLLQRGYNPRTDSYVYFSNLEVPCTTLEEFIEGESHD